MATRRAAARPGLASSEELVALIEEARVAGVVSPTAYFDACDALARLPGSDQVEAPSRGYAPVSR